MAAEEKRGKHFRARPRGRSAVPGNLSPSAPAPQALAPGSGALGREAAAGRHETEHGDPAHSPSRERAVTLWAQLWVP